jgi:hypothetical protein
MPPKEIDIAARRILALDGKSPDYDSKLNAICGKFGREDIAAVGARMDAIIDEMKRPKKSTRKQRAHHRVGGLKKLAAVLRSAGACPRMGKPVAYS